MTNLSKGIYLEDFNCYLSWNLTNEQAWKLPGADHLLGKDDFDRIKWNSKVFNGLQCRVSTYIPNNERLLKISVALAENKDCRINPATEYIIIFNQLLQELGKPEIETKKGAIRAPVLKWRVNDCLLSLYFVETHLEFTIVEIEFNGAD